MYSIICPDSHVVFLNGAKFTTKVGDHLNNISIRFGSNLFIVGCYINRLIEKLSTTDLDDGLIINDNNSHDPMGNIS